MNALTNCAYVPDSSIPVERFTKVKGEELKEIATKVASYGFSLSMTEQELLHVASQISGKSADRIISEGACYAAQRAITAILTGKGKQGSLGSADERIEKAIYELRQMIATGEIRQKTDKISDSAIAGRARTGVTTVRSCLDRRPDLKRLLTP